jgi:DNA-binding transcriptional ArsR family regulator
MPPEKAALQELKVVTFITIDGFSNLHIIDIYQYPYITIANIMINQELRNEVMRMHAQVCAALADPTRILILYSVSEQPRSVGDLTKTLEVSQPTVSRHLQNLRDRRLVVATREGQNIFYSLADKRIIQALDLLRAVLADDLSHQGILAEKVDMAQISGGKQE